MPPGMVRSAERGSCNSSQVSEEQVESVIHTAVNQGRQSSDFGIHFVVSEGIE